MDSVFPESDIGHGARRFLEEISASLSGGRPRTSEVRENPG